MTETHPQLHVIAGPNGAGKTTFAREFLPRYAGCPHFVNADLIAAGLSPFAPELAAVRAGRLMLEEIRRLAGQRINFAFETTLAGRGHAALLRELREQGYRVYLYFLWLPDVRVALQRVADRVQRGGHNVPENDVRRRFGRGRTNFFRLYRPLADCWLVHDSSGPRLHLLAMQLNGAVSIVDEDGYRQFLGTL